MLGKVNLSPALGPAQFSHALACRLADVSCHPSIIELAFPLYLAHTLSGGQMSRNTTDTGARRHGVALRFQEKDEIDSDVEKKKRESLRFGGCISGVMFIFYAVGMGLFDFFADKTLTMYKQEIGGFLAFLLAVAFAELILSPLYEEFRFRTKEIDGKVSAIEEAVNASKGGHAELLERLTAIEEKLAEIQGSRRHGQRPLPD
jgi:hypothetical protein